MPTYEYICKNCEHALEAFQKVSDPPLLKCPECGLDALQKRMSASAFVLKGGGWYVTDFRDKGKKKSETASEASDTQADTDTKEAKSTVQKEPQRESGSEQT